MEIIKDKDYRVQYNIYKTKTDTPIDFETFRVKFAILVSLSMNKATGSENLIKKYREELKIDSNVVIA